MTEKHSSTYKERLDPELEELLNSLDDDFQESKPTTRREIKTSVKEPISTPEPVKTSFPSFQESRLSKSSEDALQLLKQACHEQALHGDYEAMRGRICQLQIELNEYALLAPSFRPRPKALRKKGKDSSKGFTATDTTIHRDLIVIDCHWLFKRNEKIRVDPGDMLYQPLFDQTAPFNYELAWRFSQENWRNNTRALKALRLPARLQYQLATLRSNEIKQNLERLKTGCRRDGHWIGSPVARVGIALQEWIDEDPRVADQFSIYEAMYQAYWLLGPACKQTVLAELTGLIHGSMPLHPRTLSGKLEKLLNRMGEEWAKTGPYTEKYS